MSKGNANARRLFGKAVHQSPDFTRAVRALGPDTMESIVLAVATHYPRFRRLKHGLVLGQLSADWVADYDGPPLQFVYKVLSTKIHFACVRTGGFSHGDLETIEALYDL